MSNYRGEIEYIVTKSDMLNAVRYALECDFSKTAIVDLLMKNIEKEIETALEDDCGEMTDEMWAKLNDALENAPTIEPEPQWIPCSERLPEYDGEKYLVTLYCDRINVVSTRISSCYMNREGFWSDVPIGYKVTAWMPLPDPYKEEERCDKDH